MDIGEIISKSFKYPINDFSNFKFVILFFLLLLIPVEILTFDVPIYLEIISFILIFIFVLIIPGYLLSIVKCATNREDEIPCFNIKHNIVNTIKYALLNITYLIFPFILILVLISLSGLSFFNDFPLDQVNVPIAIITMILSVIIMVVVSFVLNIATARFAHYDSLNKGIEFKQVYYDIKKIGLGNTIIWLIAINVIFNIILYLGVIIGFIPYMGIIIYILFIMPFSLLFHSYSIGLIYSNIVCE